MSEFLQDFANNLKKRRMELNLKQAQLAEKAGVTVQTISSIENAKHFPAYKKLIRISAALQVHPAQLIIGDSECWNIEDKELQYILVEQFKHLSPKQRAIALKLVQSISELDI